MTSAPKELMKEKSLAPDKGGGLHGEVLESTGRASKRDGVCPMVMCGMARSVMYWGAL